MIRAAGGIVERDGLVLLVHRPKYDDWTFPKGKAAGDETDEHCAVREVHEETGIHCLLERELGFTRYVDARGRPKRVRWWLMKPVTDDGFVANAEVDEVCWVNVAAAATMLSYGRDVKLLAAL